MTQVKTEINPQLVYLDQFLVDRARIALGWSQKEVVQRIVRRKGAKEDVSLHYRTFKRIASNEGLFPETAFAIAKALKREVSDLYAPWDPRYIAPSNPSGPLQGSEEWDFVNFCKEPGRLASNRLYYIVCRMRHKHTANLIGRGKYYLLSTVPTVKREELRHQLARHADVCARVGVSLHLPVTHTNRPADEGWWVIDYWVGEQTLADHLERGAWPQEKLPRLLHEIAIGLDTLHLHNVVLRELAPSRVLISDQDGRAVLTDFELAKLLDGGPSVSGDWPEDKYRAPEVELGNVTIRADVYSFGRVALACLTEPGIDAARLPVELEKAGIPKGLAKLLADCAEPTPDRRPPNMSLLLTELARWAKRSPGSKV